MSFKNKEAAKDSSGSSPGRDAGAIDTRAPFQSVKAAVSLFGEVAVSKERRSGSIKRRSSENVLEKETQLLLAQRELIMIKKHLDSAETTRSKTLSELDKTNATLQDLTKKLINVRESKESAIEAAEVVKNKARELERALSQKAIGYEAWKRELEHARKEYITTVKELDASKQELNKIRQDFDSALEAKLAAFQTAGEAQRSAKLNMEKINEFSKQITAMKQSIEQLKLASAQAQEEHIKAIQERETKMSYYQTAKEATNRKLEELKNEYDPEESKRLEEKLTQTSEEIQVLQEQVKEMCASEMDSVKVITEDINEAKETLQEVVAEENSLRRIMDALRTEFEQVKKEQWVLKEKEQEAEALASNLTGELESSKEEAGPKPGSAEDGEANDVANEINFKIQKLSLETEHARREEEEMRIQAEEFKQEAERSRVAAEELEKKLEETLKQAEEAKAAEQKAIAEMKLLSEMQSSTVSESGVNGKIILTVEEFAALSGKIKESEDLIERTETAVIAQAQAINSRRNEVDKKVEANLKAIQEIKAATDMALRNAEMADNAKLTVESELKRRRQEEQNAVSDLDYAENSSRPISLRI